MHVTLVRRPWPPSSGLKKATLLPPDLCRQVQVGLLVVSRQDQVQTISWDNPGERHP